MVYAQTCFGLDNGKDQVFVFICPGNIPFLFARHPWFVINKHGALSRWEVIFRKIERETSWGHLQKDLYPPFQGIEIIPFCLKYFWEGTLLGKIEGDAAARIAEFIEGSPDAYPHAEKYSLRGPNSNTYAQWVLNNFPEWKIELPWNSFGKNYIR